MKKFPRRTAKGRKQDALVGVGQLSKGAGTTTTTTTNSPIDDAMMEDGSRSSSCSDFIGFSESTASSSSNLSGQNNRSPSATLTTSSSSVSIPTTSPIINSDKENTTDSGIGNDTLRTIGNDTLRTTNNTSKEDSSCETNPTIKEASSIDHQSLTQTTPSSSERLRESSGDDDETMAISRYGASSDNIENLTMESKVHNNCPK